MKKEYQAPVLRKSKLKALTLLSGSIPVVPGTVTDQQYGKENSIFDSVFRNESEDDDI